MVPAITNSVVLPLLLPPLIEQLVGPQRKAASLGLLSSVVYVLGLSMPFLGAFSDKCHNTRCGRRFGRRRPFIVAGQLLNSSGLFSLLFATTFTYILLGFSVTRHGLTCPHRASPLIGTQPGLGSRLVGSGSL